MSGGMQKDRFGRVGVLAGGPSNEREISLRSGRAVYDALISDGVDAVFLDVKGDVRDIVKANRIDVAFIALHGRFGEDGTVQAILEELGVPYTGSGIESSKLALDKIASKELFVKMGIPTPRYEVHGKDDPDIGRCASVDIPVVVKPQFEGSSIGLSIVRKKSDLRKAEERAFKYGDRILIEEYVEGRELTVGILDNEPLPVIEIVTRNRVYDYAAKYTDPDTKYLVPAPISDDMAKRSGELGRMAHDALGCRSFSRVDIIMDDRGGLFVLEVNTIPGMTERSLLPKASREKGLNFGELCIKIIEGAVSPRGR